jgi:hypothetical protein
MKKTRVIRIVLLSMPLLLLAILVVASIASAGDSASYSLNWQVLSGGGAPAESSSGQVSLNGTLGQTAIGPSSTGEVTLGAGFWYGLGIRILKVFLPIILHST